MTASFKKMAEIPNGVHQLSSGVNWLPVSQTVKKMLTFEIENELTIRNYGNATGARIFTDTLSHFFRPRGGKEVSVSMTNGTSHGAFLIFESLVETEKLSEVIYLSPSYPHYDFLCRHYNLKKTEIFNSDDPCGEKLLSDLITKACQVKNSLIVILDPLNPTGQILSYDILKIIIIAAAHNGNNVLIDTVCLMPGDDKRFIEICSLPSLYENVLVISSNSKYSGLAGLRSGFIIQSKDLKIPIRAKILAQCLNPVVFGTFTNLLIYSQRYSNVNSCALPEKLYHHFKKNCKKIFTEYPEDMSKIFNEFEYSEIINSMSYDFSTTKIIIQNNYSTIADFCNLLDIKPPDLHAGFNVALPMSALTDKSEDITKSELLSRGVGVLTSSDFSSSKDISLKNWYIRFGLAIPQDNFNKGIEVIMDYFKKN